MTDRRDSEAPRPEMQAQVDETLARKKRRQLLLFRIVGLSVWALTMPAAYMTAMRESGHNTAYSSGFAMGTAIVPWIALGITKLIKKEDSLLPWQIFLIAAIVAMFINTNPLMRSL